jgi:hypothetical protein
MKCIAFIVLGLVLLAAIAGIVLWANMPTAKVTIRAVRPMETNVSWLDWEGKLVSSPVWEVAITNSGRAPAHWIMPLCIKDGEAMKQSYRSSYTQPTDGVLFPKQHTNAYMQVPGDSATKWIAEVEYHTYPSPFERKLFLWSRSVPKLQKLFPNTRLHFAYDAWHVGTNVTTAH